MAKGSGVSKKTKVAIVVSITLLVIASLFVFRSYLEENFNIGADTVSVDDTERMLASKKATDGDFSSDTLSNTKLSNGKIVLITTGTGNASATQDNPIKGTIKGTLALAGTPSVSKLVLGSTDVDNSCTKTQTKASLSVDGSSAWTEWYTSNTSTLTVGSVKAKALKYEITLSSCSNNYTPAITSLSVFGYKSYDISLPPTPSDPMSSVTATPPVPTIPSVETTPPSPEDPADETASASSTTVAVSSAFGTAGDSVETIALGSIQSGVSFWLIIAIVALIGGGITYKIIKQKE